MSERKKSAGRPESEALRRAIRLCGPEKTPGSYAERTQEVVHSANGDASQQSPGSLEQAGE